MFFFFFLSALTILPAEEAHQQLNHSPNMIDFCNFKSQFISSKDESTFLNTLPIKTQNNKIVSVLFEILSLQGQLARQ